MSRSAACTDSPSSQPSGPKLKTRPSPFHLSNTSVRTGFPTAIIMSPRTSELDDDFILGIAFSIIWKAPRITTQNISLAHFAKLQHLAKLNVSIHTSPTQLGTWRGW